MRYKLLFDNGTWGFFDMQSDPMEPRDLSGDPAFASVRTKLAAELASLKAGAVRGCLQGSGSPAPSDPRVTVGDGGQVGMAKAG